MKATSASLRLRKSATLTVADLFARFGPMPIARIRSEPLPGTATEKDLLRIDSREDRLCELIDGILVEKTEGYEESLLAAWICTLLNNFVQPARLGLVAGEAGMLKFAPGLVRIPDVSFVSRKRLPKGKRPKGPIPRLVPNLAVEVLSFSNTDAEMRRKLSDYFDAGVELVWFFDPRRRTVEVFTAVDESVVLRENQTLTGGAVLPGFKAKLSALFGPLDDE